LPKETKIPTVALPNNTPIPPTAAIQPTSTISSIKLQQDFIDATRSFPLKVEDIEIIDLVRGENCILQIEFMNRWASKERQAVASYQLIQMLSKTML
jgi:hypothetical protein